MTKMYALETLVRAVSNEASGQSVLPRRELLDGAFKDARLPGGWVKDTYMDDNGEIWISVAIFNEYIWPYLWPSDPESSAGRIRQAQAKKEREELEASVQTRAGLAAIRAQIRGARSS
jgi:hypothetical protein